MNLSPASLESYVNGIWIRVPDFTDLTQLFSFILENFLETSAIPRT